MYEPQRLHPISYVLSIVDTIKRNFFFIIIFVFFQWDSFDYTKPSNLIWPGFLTIAFVVGFVNRTIEIYRTRYWIENEYFVVTSGLFNLERKELNIQRIQSMDTLQPIVHLLVGGVRLVIKTPSDGVTLDMVTKKQSQWIQQEIEKAKVMQAATDAIDVGDQLNEAASHTHQEVGNSAPKEVIYRMSMKHLLLMGMTSGALFIVLGSFWSLLGSFAEWIPWNKMFSQVEGWIKDVTVLVAVIFVLVLFISYIVGICMTILRYYGFTLTRNGDFLNVRYGLFKVTNLTVPLHKLQAIEEKKSFFRHWLGYTSYRFVITSDMDVDFADDFATGKINVLPFVQRRQGQEMIKTLVSFNTLSTTDIGLPWRGFQRRFWLIGLLLLAVGGVSHYYVSKWVWIPIGVVLIYLIVHSFIATRWSGRTFTDEEAAIRVVSLFGFKTMTFKRDKILGFQQRAHPLMRRGNLSHFHFTIARGSIYENIGMRFEDHSKVENYKKWYIEGGGR
ncbi:PH domain-containing protein [Staphylococcus lutrae]|uniref:YdbS-like PH domain-containing protein n=2 Tax=Staphylococcus lutrae TaxID=155085 RepID=A0AAC9RMW0_9STAP|nr:PH domain-containing protein [Staphylococcus lutrae]ARJ50243.1 hypothetical protein B5P37_02385 [Staphylococcus lutrae]PNZ37645.1 hypothetical protein CD134_05965 [Staphylococcus lutrae]